MKKVFSNLILLSGIIMLFAACGKPNKPDPDPDPGGDNNSLPKTTKVLSCDFFSSPDAKVLKKNDTLSVDYIINCMAVVNGELTIEPGVTIAFDKDAGLDFSATSSFRIAGTIDKPILFTGKEKTAGYWSGICVDGTSAGNLMRYVHVEYAGGAEQKPGVRAGVGIVGNDAHLVMEFCKVSNCEHDGLAITGSREVVLNNNKFSANNYPVRASFNSNLIFSNTSNNFNGNTYDYIYLNYGNTFDGSGILTKLDIPYLLKSTASDGIIHVDNGTLTVKPGVTMLMENAKTQLKIDKNGAIKMVGTAAEPINIKGIEDTAGSWDCINIMSSNNKNEIGYTNIVAAGRKSGGYPNASVWLNNGKYLNIHDVVFKDCTEFGIAFNYEGAQRFVLIYNNLTLNNTPKLFSEWSGVEIPDPENP